MTSGKEYEAVIGLEVHVQLATATKLFCDCPNAFGAEPNRNTCPVCSGHPGVLPLPNREAVHLGVRAALMLGCEIQGLSRFVRKHYFYPDLPKGYQISQFARPLALGGEVPLGEGRRVGLERIHLEEDAGKSLHRKGRSLVDLNRAGVPLIEIVGRPELRTPAEARAYLESLRQAMRYAGASDCDMEKGSLRCDTNVSLRPPGSALLGTKVEIKNLNSFSMVEKALAFEIERQTRLLAGGGEQIQETRLWDEDRGVTRSMRTKEDLRDYRYLPDPDLPCLRLEAGLVAEIQASLPEAPWDRRARLRDRWGLSEHDARVLTLDRETADFFEETARSLGEGKAAANWVMTEVLRLVNEGKATLPGLSAGALAALIRLVEEDRVSHRAARKVYPHMVETGMGAAEALADLGLSQISDPGVLEALVEKAIEGSPKAVADYRKGKKKALDALKGRVMRETGGRADPGVVGEILSRLLSEDR